ncbi:hypothetical protein HT594_00041 [Phenacoccus solenopsis nudivirus]|nr:hypothetical protein HT594_00041 [Phenacoccus solenopsis nudivirus]
MMANVQVAGATTNMYNTTNKTPIPYMNAASTSSLIPPELAVQSSISTPMKPQMLMEAAKAELAANRKASYDMASNAMAISENFELDEKAINEHLKNPELLADYKTLCKASLNLDTLHFVYSKLPQELGIIRNNFNATNLDLQKLNVASMAFFQAYMEVIGDLVLKYPSLSDLLLVLIRACLLKYATQDILTHFKKESISVSMNLNKLLIKRRATFKLPKSLKLRKLQTGESASSISNAGTDNATTNNNANKEAADSTKSESIEQHPINKLPYMQPELLRIGELFNQVISIEFLPIHGRVRLDTLKLYSQNEKDEKSVAGITIDANIRIFTSTSLTRRKTYGYDYIDDRYSRSFVSYVDSVVKNKKLLRYNFSTKKQMDYLNFSNFHKMTQKNENQIRFVLFDNMKFYCVRSRDEIRTNEMSMQSFPAVCIQVDCKEYNDLMETKLEDNIAHCDELQKKYNLEYENDEDDDEAPAIAAAEQQNGENTIHTNDSASNPPTNDTANDTILS